MRVQSLPTACSMVVALTALALGGCLAPTKSISLGPGDFALLEIQLQG